MRTLCFDTETTGFITSKPLDDPSQPECVQLAAVLVDDNLEEMASFSFLVYGFLLKEIPSSASYVHGITLQRVTAFGVRPLAALVALSDLASKADRIVGFNSQFDVNVVEAMRLRYEPMLTVTALNVDDVMLPAADVCKLPGRYAGAYKWPKLGEAYKSFFGDEMVAAHDALVDVRATLRCYKHLRELGVMA